MFCVYLHVYLCLCLCVSVCVRSFVSVSVCGGLHARSKKEGTVLSCFFFVLLSFFLVGFFSGVSLVGSFFVFRVSLSASEVC